jgi:hypothetical protein
MKFTLASSILFTTLFLASSYSVEAERIRGGKIALTSNVIKSDKTALRRRLEDEEQEEANDDAAADEANDDAADADADEEDAAEEGEEAEEEAEEEVVEESDDDYTFYDDEAIANCDEDDEDCQKAAEYAAYDDEYLSACEDEDEDCQEAAAYITAKKAKEEAEASTGGWKSYPTEKFSEMSKSSKIWTISLSVWFALLAIGTIYFCCCKTSSASPPIKSSNKKSLKKSLIGGSSTNGDGDSADTEEGRGRSKFRIFGRKGSNNKTKGSTKSVVE